jgi:sensor domain CHASE-containing protein
MLLEKSSLTYKVLIQMSIRIALVIVIITLISYWHLMSVLESQTQEQLRKYITERGLRESSIFLLAQDNHAIFKQQLLSKLAEWGDQDPQMEFDQFRQMGRWHYP